VFFNDSWQRQPHNNLKLKTSTVRKLKDWLKSPSRRIYTSISRSFKSEVVVISNLSCGFVLRLYCSLCRSDKRNCSTCWLCLVWKYTSKCLTLLQVMTWLSRLNELRPVYIVGDLYVLCLCLCTALCSNSCRRLMSVAFRATYNVLFICLFVYLLKCLAYRKDATCADCSAREEPEDLSAKC